MPQKSAFFCLWQNPGRNWTSHTGTYTPYLNFALACAGLTHTPGLVLVQRLTPPLPAQTVYLTV